MKTIFEVVAAVMLSVGGAGVIILALSNFLGRVWANRILESDKARYNREIEDLKNKFNVELECYKSQLELSRQVLSRYFEHQFSLYKDLWLSLVELKEAGDSLKQDFDSVIDLIIAVGKARNNLLKNALLIEETHEIQLSAILDKFANYSVGNFKLARWEEKQKEPGFRVELGDALANHSIKEDIKKTKEEYDNLFLLIKASLRKQLREIP